MVRVSQTGPVSTCKASSFCVKAKARNRMDSSTQLAHPAFEETQAGIFWLRNSSQCPCYRYWWHKRTLCLTVMGHFCLKGLGGRCRLYASSITEEMLCPLQFICLVIRAFIDKIFLCCVELISRRGGEIASFKHFIWLSEILTMLLTYCFYSPLKVIDPACVWIKSYWYL